MGWFALPLTASGEGFAVWCYVWLGFHPVNANGLHQSRIDFFKVLGLETSTNAKADASSK